MGRPAALRLASVVLLAGALGACGGADQDPSAGTGEEASEETGGQDGTHVMPDGTVMEGESHGSDGSHESHGGSDHGSGDHHHSGTDGGPSHAAAMICAGDVVDDVNRIMDTGTRVSPTSGWEEPVFTCNFTLDEGPVVLTVHDATSAEEGRTHFRDLRAGTSGAESIVGVPSLGLPSFRSSDGIVAFIRDGKTLEVDTTRLRGRGFGVGGERTRSDVAYAMAASVLACWTEHA